MWWEAEEDFAYAAELHRLASLLSYSHERHGEISREVFGFGSAKVDGRRIPIAVLHEGLLQPQLLAEIPSPFRLVDAVRRRFDHDRVPTPEGTLFEGSDLNKLGRDALGPLSVPDAMRFMFVDWPRPCLMPPCPGASIQVGNKRGTLGLILLALDRPYSRIRILATTAGHVIGVDANGRVERDTVELRSPWWRSRRVIGHAIAALDPIGQAGPDIAFVELLSSSAIGSRPPWWDVPSDLWWDHHLPVLPYGDRPWVLRPVELAQVPAPEGSIATLLGGESGKRRGWVDNPLLQVRGSTNRVRQWSNCWTMFEIGGGFAQLGDSGGLVRTESGAIIGHLVASMGVITRRGRRQAGLVQDIRTVLDARSGANIGRVRAMMPDPLPLDRSWGRRMLDYLRG